MANITPSQLLNAAADLLSEDAENEEYDRAIVELISTVLGLPTDYRGATEAMLRTLKN